jgi:hypothetical protein
LNQNTPNTGLRILNKNPEEKRKLNVSLPFEITETEEQKG